MPTAVSLSQMVDLSLGTPEVGAVNFNVMHSLLHAIIKKLNISDYKAEINEHDRDFLATSVRAKSILSDADSGKGADESEDGLSEKSGIPPFRPTPYHRLEIKVEKLAQQLDDLNQLPSNVELYNRATKSKGDSIAERPVADMWQYMQMKKRVDANEEGIGKLFSLIEDMMKEMKELKDANQALQDKIKGLNVDDLKKRLSELEKITTDLNDKFMLLPTPEELSQFVTWPGLEDALKGVRDDLAPAERVVIEMSSQTELPSRPNSSRPVSRLSTPGPSEQLLDVLERLGKLDTDHLLLKERVDAIEEELKNKLDKSAIEGLGVSAELLDQIKKLKEELDALTAATNKSSSVPFLGSVITVLSKVREAYENAMTAGTTSGDSDARSSRSAAPFKLVANIPEARNSASRNLAVQNQAAQNPAATNPTASNPAANTAEARNLTSQNPALHNHGIHNTAAHSRAVNNPAASNPTASNPAANTAEARNLTSQNPALHNHGIHNTAAHSRAVNNPAANNPTANNPTANNPTANDPAMNHPTAYTRAGNGTAAQNPTSQVPVVITNATVDSHANDTLVSDDDLSSCEEILNIILNNKRSQSHNSLNEVQLSALQQRVKILEDRFKLFQEMLLDDSSHHADVSDLTSWLAQMEDKIADNLTNINSVEDSEAVAGSDVEAKKSATDKEGSKKEESEKTEKAEKEKKKKRPREEVEEHQAQEEEIKTEMDKILDDADLAIPELNETNDKLKKLAYNLNEQLHGLRDKVFLVDQELKRMAKGVEFALMRAKVAGINEMDSDALTRAQQAILQLQAEVEKLHHTTSDIIDENKQRTLQIEDILKYCDKLQQEKADKDYVQMEVDVKADKKSLEAKVNTKLFDKTTEEINKMIKEILDKLAGHDESWKTAYSKLTEDIDGKLDRLELDPLKEWLESRLKALNDKLKKYQKNTDWSEDDAAGIRKQLIQRFHCISCDRPVDMMPTGPIPSLPAQGVLPATRSPRPYTTYELEQIRQHAKSRFSIGRNTINFERAIAEKQLASMKRSDLHAFLVHFKQDMELVSQQVQQVQQVQQPKASFANPEVTDYYATPRPCGGSHTLTYPHKRNTKLTHLSHLFRDETVVVPANARDEGEIQGADGHIYKGRPESRHHKLEARLPSSLGGNNNNNISVHVRSSSPHPPQNRRGNGSALVTQRARPISARTPPSPRPSSAGQALQQGSRPQSAKVVITHEVSEPAEIPQTEFIDEPVDEVQATMDVNKQEPLDQDTVQVDVETA